MSRLVYRLTFENSIEIKSVEETLLLAILAVSCLHGDAAVRLDARYAIDAATRVIVLDGTTEIGSAVARIFIGFCTREFGDASFKMSRSDGPPPEPSTRRSHARGASP